MAWVTGSENRSETGWAKALEIQLATGSGMVSGNKSETESEMVLETR